MSRQPVGAPPPSLSHHDFQKADFFVGHSVLLKEANHLIPLHHWTENIRHCWWTNPAPPRMMTIPKTKKALTIPGGAGFLPSKRSQQTPKVDFIPPRMDFCCWKTPEKKTLSVKRAHSTTNPNNALFCLSGKSLKRTIDSHGSDWWSIPTLLLICSEKMAIHCSCCPSLITAHPNVWFPLKQGSHDAWPTAVCSKTSSFESILKDDPLPMLSDFDRFSPATWNSMCFVGGETSFQRRSSKEHHPSWYHSSKPKPWALQQNTNKNNFWAY